MIFTKKQLRKIEKFSYHGSLDADYGKIYVYLKACIDADDGIVRDRVSFTTTDWYLGNMKWLVENGFIKTRNVTFMEKYGERKELHYWLTLKGVTALHLLNIKIEWSNFKRFNKKRKTMLRIRKTFNLNIKSKYDSDSID